MIAIHFHHCVEYFLENKYYGKVPVTHIARLEKHEDHQVVEQKIENIGSQKLAL